MMWQHENLVGTLPGLIMSEGVARLSDENVNLGYGDDHPNGLKVWQMILHDVNLGIQNRSEATAILTGFGQSPGELDFDLFLKEKPEYL
jgi:hypothetical protein